jgi:cell division septal protein FtsQ
VSRCDDVTSGEASLILPNILLQEALMKKTLSKTKRKEPFSAGKNRFKHFLYKFTVWVFFALLPISIILMLKYGVSRLFFSGNPHFLLKHIQIEIVKGNFNRNHILDKISFKPGTDNLYAIDLGRLRRQILQDPVVQEVEVRRILPDTISMNVYGRTPIAQLIRSGGRLIDANAVILGYGPKSEKHNWPIITGIQKIKSYETGEKLDNPFVSKAINFLLLKEVITNGNRLDVQVIQLDENYQELRVYLNGKKEHFIRDGAVVKLPFEDMEKALSRALDILDHRAAAQQPTRSIDVTYQKKVPVRP